MREKDYRKLYECEFPIMEPPITKKDIFAAKLTQKPIVLNVSKWSREDRDWLEELLWHYGAFTPVEDYHGWYYVPNVTINLRVKSSSVFMSNWEQRIVGKKYKIPRDEYKRYKKLVEINK